MAASGEPELLEAPKRTFYQRHEAAILGSVSVAVGLAMWQALWSSGAISPLFFTGPSSIVNRFAEEWTEGRLKSDIVYSGTNFVIGVGLAIVVGVVFGVIIGWWPPPRDARRPVLTALLHAASRWCRSS